MKASDYIMQVLAESGVTHIYEVIGGMITHLIDSAHCNEKIALVSVHHEQAAAFAADATGRITGIPGVAMATSGPGAVNLLTGIGSCYFDSVPAIFITGQVNLHEQKADRAIRQQGFQETDIVSMARPITKAAWNVRDVQEIPGLLEEAFRITTSGRPGPVLLDIPMDIQRMDISETPRAMHRQPAPTFSDESSLHKLVTALACAQKPLILVGGGIQASRTTPLLRKFIEYVQVPVVHSLMAGDVLPYDHPLRIGFIGSYGNRWANMGLGSCDLLLVLGSRMDIRQTGADVVTFAAGRAIYHVDSEAGELNNRVKGCHTIHADLTSFLPAAIAAVQGRTIHAPESWLSELHRWQSEWPDTKEVGDIPGINPNAFMHQLSVASHEASAYVVDVGNHQMWAAQSLEVRKGQRLITSGGMGSMGFSLPAAMGVAFSQPGEPVVQVCGDGGMQMNIQELQTVAHHHLPIKMVVLNNGSYGMVRQFQQSYFHDRYASTYWGYSAPDFVKVANAYGIQGGAIQQESEIAPALEKLWLDPSQPYLLQVSINLMANVYPKIAFGYPITEMEPFAKPLDMEGT